MGKKKPVPCLGEREDFKDIVIMAKELDVNVAIRYWVRERYKLKLSEEHKCFIPVEDGEAS